MYHVELRQFPHNLCRFNLSEHELRAIAERWAREQWVALGDRKWDPIQARLTILEGPKLGSEQLTMGRGWRAAQRSGADVTGRVLADARARLAGAPAAAGAPPAGAVVAPLAAGASPPGAHTASEGARGDVGSAGALSGAAGGEPGVARAGTGGVGAPPGSAGGALWGGGAGPGEAGGEPGVAGVAPGSASSFPGAATAEGRELALHSDSLGLELLQALSESPLPLVRAWALAHERFPARAPSECLALAELAVRSLVQRRLLEVVAVEARRSAGSAGADEARPGATDEAGRASRAAASGEALEGVAAEAALARFESWSGSAVLTSTA